jgi:hypothetical protein
MPDVRGFLTFLPSFSLLRVFLQSFSLFRLFLHFFSLLRLFLHLSTDGPGNRIDLNLRMMDASLFCPLYQLSLALSKLMTHNADGSSRLQQSAAALAYLHSNNIQIL